MRASRAAVVVPNGTSLRRWRLRPHQGGTAEGIQPAHHRPAAQRRVRAVHQHPDEHPVLRPVRPDARSLVLRTTAAGRDGRTTPRPRPSSSRNSPRCIQWWGQHGGRKTNGPGACPSPNCWNTIRRLAPAVNLDRKNPRGKEDITHLPPEQIAESILKKEQRIAEIMGNIRKLLAGSVKPRDPRP